MLARSTALFILLTAAIVRVIAFQRNALYPIPFPTVIGHDLLLVVPYLFPALILPWSSGISVLVLAVLVAGGGLNLDYHHFAHLNKESAIDGVSYIGHTLLSILGSGFTFIFFYEKRRN